jgi:predicted Zn-dependent protease
LSDPSPLVRRALAELSCGWDRAARGSVVARLLGDRTLSVRLEAAQGLLEVAFGTWSAAERAAFALVQAELRASLAYHADRAAALLKLARLEQVHGDPALVPVLYQRALALEPGFAGAYANYADYLASKGQFDGALRVIEDGLKKSHDRASLEHAMGLLLVRAGNRDAALEHLERAHELAPDSPRLAYVYAVALYEADQQGRAIALLEKLHQRFDGDLGLLSALAGYQAKAGDAARARELDAKVAGIRARRRAAVGR